MRPGEMGQGMTEVSGKVRIQIWNCVLYHGENRASDYVRTQLIHRVGDKIWIQVSGQVRNMVCDQVRRDETRWDKVGS